MKKNIFLLTLVLMVAMLIIVSCAPTTPEPSPISATPEPEPSRTIAEPGVSQNVTVSQNITVSRLVAQASTYNGTTVTMDAFYFDAIYKGSRLADAVSLDAADEGKVVPVGEIIGMGGWLWQGLRNQLYTQNESISPTNTEYFGKLRITGTFCIDEVNGQYWIEMSSAEGLEWTPPHRGTTVPNGNLQINIEGIFGGKPLQGAEAVSSKQPDDQPKLSGLTDSEGKITFDDIKQGGYEFTVSLADYTPMIIKLTVTGGRTASPAFFMARVGEAPDDYFPAPGLGPQYQANINVVGWTNPWPLIEGTTVTLGTAPDAMQISYRDYIETEAGQVRNNMFIITGPGSNSDDPQFEVTLTATSLPPGITVTQAWDWGRGTLSKTGLQIHISPDVTPGEYSFGFAVEINGRDYGTVPCTIKVTEPEEKA